MACNWIWHDSRKDSPYIAIQIVGIGYIPWHPYGGRHVVDDFGNLVEALPYQYHQTKTGI